MSETKIFIDDWKFILNDKGEPEPIQDIIKWGTWLEEARATSKLVVEVERIGHKTISTVFLGLNHNILGATPVLWETAVFDDVQDSDIEIFRCSGLREDALKMHNEVAKKVRDMNENGISESLKSDMEYIASCSLFKL